MQNQPPTGRPLFRLLSQARMELSPQPAQPTPTASRTPSPAIPLVRPSAPQPQTPSPQPRAPSPQPPSPQPRAPSPQPRAPSPQPPSPQPRAPSPQPQPSAPSPPAPPQPQPFVPSPPLPQPSTLQSPQAPTEPQPFQTTQEAPPPSSSVRTVERQQTQMPLASPTLPPAPRTIAAPRSTTPPESPRVIKPSPTPPPSPNSRQSLLLPLPEPEPKAPSLPQPKSIIVQEDTIKNGMNKPMGMRTPPQTKREDDSAASNGSGYVKAATRKREEDKLSLITIAGENMGAYMDLGTPRYQQHPHNSKKQDGHTHHPGHDSKSDSKGKFGEKVTKEATKTKPKASLVNSNVQSVNNSILFNTACNAKSPGVHITLASHHAKPHTRTPPSREGNHHSNTTTAADHGH